MIGTAAVVLDGRLHDQPELRRFGVRADKEGLEPSLVTGVPRNRITTMVEPLVTLKSAPTAKWPRYEIRLPPGLSTREASKAAAQLLRTAQRPVVLFSQFKYDPKTGVVDTRIKT